MPYQVIVVGFDRSERGAIAVTEALHLARDTGATLHAVHVVHPAVASGTVSSTAFQTVVDQERAEVDVGRSELLAHAERHGVTVEFHTSAMSDIPEAILSTAGSVGADLVVVGNRGMSGKARFLLGSVPNKVAHHSPCSVLIVNTELP